jgi:hypothetical protein
MCPRPGAFVQYVSEMSACSEVIPESCVAEYSVLSIVNGARECELDAALVLVQSGTIFSECLPNLRRPSRRSRAPQLGITFNRIGVLYVL